jgi:hypothetical protein
VAGFLFHRFSINWRNIDAAVSVAPAMLNHDFAIFRALQRIAFVVCNDGIDKHHRLDAIEVIIQGSSTSRSSMTS